MPVATHEIYCKMLDNALRNQYAYPAINVVSMESANAAIQGFAEAKSDGIIQVSTGGGKHASGAIGDSALGAITIAKHVHRMAKHYNIYVALHTDHCQKTSLDSFVMPLIAESEKRIAKGKGPLFQSHMFDGGTLAMSENVKIAKDLAVLCAKNQIILEVEAGVVGGEEDGVHHNPPREKLFTTPEDMMMFYDELAEITGGKFLLAATFGNVHGSYKPGNVQLKPKILKAGQDDLKSRYGADKNYYLVFHGGSGSTKEEIAEAVSYGVVKMNVDTDTQYAFTRPIVDHMLKNYDGVLKIEGEVGSKKVYDPRVYITKGADGMKDRIIEACNDLNSSGQTIFEG